MGFKPQRIWTYDVYDMLLLYLYFASLVWTVLYGAVHINHDNNNNYNIKDMLCSIQALCVLFVPFRRQYIHNTSSERERELGVWRWVAKVLWISSEFSVNVVAWCGENFRSLRVSRKITARSDQFWEQNCYSNCNSRIILCFARFVLYYWTKRDEIF